MVSIPEYDFSTILNDADVLLIVPPFAEFRWPSLAVHILQACAKRAGFTAQVFYANLALAALIHEDIYQQICDRGALGEAIFARHAYGKKLADFIGKVEEGAFKESIVEIEGVLDGWIRNLMTEILKYRYRVLGCTTSFEQTNSSIALVNFVKQLRPEIITVLGGANCQDILAEGILLLSDKIDYVFSGESDFTFPNFLKEIIGGILPKERIIREQLYDLNEIPAPDYSDYIRQLQLFLPDWESKKKYSLMYETSRGCWWGKKHHCRFCGTFGVMKYREKTPDRIIHDLRYLTESNHQKRIIMTDCIMPFQYFKNLLPKLASQFSHLDIFYELKANATFEQLLLLKKAGINRIQPGIETISSSLLKRMNKGVLARQNIALLRNCTSLGISCAWNFLYGFPNDTEDDYLLMQPLLPLLTHLYPPLRCSHVVLARFSPYYNFPEKFGIKNIQPASFYKSWFPTKVLSKVASVFEGEYKYFSRPDNPLIQELRGQIEKWQALWKNEVPPKLKIITTLKGKYLLIDTRGLSQPLVRTVSEKQVLAVLFDRPMNTVPNELQKEINWGLENKLVVTVDSWFISLVTAESGLIITLKKENQIESKQVIG